MFQSRNYAAVELRQYRHALSGERHSPCAAVPYFLPVARSGKPHPRKEMPARATGRLATTNSVDEIPAGPKRNNRTIVLHGCRFFCRRLLLVEQVLDTLQSHAQLRGRRERFRDLVA